MPKETLTRRELFSKILQQKEVPETAKDVLFDKYSRKEFPGRTYHDANEINTNERSSGNDERIGNVTSGLTQYNGAWTDWEMMHLLRRTGYGFRKTDVDTLSALTMSNAVDLILNIDNTVPAPPVNFYQNIQPDENGLPYGSDYTNDAIDSYTNLGQTTNLYRSEGLKLWSLGLSLNQDITIREKMTWFWYHFIPVDFTVVFQSSNAYAGTNSARICYQYIKMFRDNALGNFKTIIRNMATQPAMMFYLNNQANTNTAPDENFAREVMELFTLGKDPLSQYTQADVIQAAKVLTGWRVQNLNTTATSTDFVSSFHDTSSKQFSSFFNNTVIPNTGASELDAFIDMIFSKTQVVSEYVCRRLYRYFVYYDIDANIEANIITPLAQTFVANNWNIVPVLKQLFKSEHFFDIANRGVYIKSPLDVVVGSARLFNINFNVSDPSNHQAQYEVWSAVNNELLFPMNQVYGSVPNVSGWQPYYQNPSFHEYWINSNTTQKRFATLLYIFTGFTLTNNGLNTHIEVDPIAFVQQFPNSICQDPDLLTAECIKYLLPIDLSAAQKSTLKFQTLLYSQITNSYWTTAWNNYTTTPANPTYKAIVKTRLKGLLSTIAQYAEFQLM
ncbi:MAG: DUF1800 family protein [Chitinophagales bacterium]